MSAAWFAIAVSVLSVAAWLWLLIRSFKGYQRHVERRPMWLAMPIVGVIASFGTLASALGYWAALEPSVELPSDVLTLVASMGRGALLMAAIVSLAYYRRPHK
jgi:hypothetical protein